MTYFNSPSIIAKARKAHRCSWCGEVIAKGTVYHRRYSCSEGIGSTVKQHPECAAAETLFHEQSDDTEWEFFTFTRGCTCESGDSGHGTYDTCTKKEVGK